jgi:two-component system, sensor histidine kinase and response regulator
MENYKLDNIEAAASDPVLDARAVVKPRLLVVEDDVNLLEGIRNILELDGYEVLTAENGQQALELLQTLPAMPNLIVSDIMMPVMDGFEFLKAFRQQRHWVETPFIYLTAKGEKSDVQRGKELGVDDYVTKPFDASDLLVAVKARLKRSNDIIQINVDRMADLKRSILTIINHEFRTPLTFIVAYADMLSNPESTLGSTDIVNFLKGVGHGAERIRRLIENFILLVELETQDAHRTYAWRKRSIEDLRDVINVAASRAAQMDEGKHPINIHIPEQLPNFTGDSEYLMIAITQLLGNAIKFSNAQTPVTVSVYVQGDELHIAVKDEGRGIPAEEIEKIWDTFYQINRPHYEDQGAGSGLKIVRGIATMHNGRIDVQSVVGVGSTFTLCLPLAKAQ